MAGREATVVWRGNLRHGRGEASTPNGTLQGVPLTYARRFQEAPGASPEQFMAAAHAGCFSMALAAGLEQRGHPPAQLTTRATVTIEPRAGSWAITRSQLEVNGQVPGIDSRTFEEAAREAQEMCPVSRALAGNVEISLTASLEPVAVSEGW